MGFGVESHRFFYLFLTAAPQVDHLEIIFAISLMRLLKLGAKCGALGKVL